MKILLFRIYSQISTFILSFFQEPGKIKARYELKYWKVRKMKEGVLSNDIYEYYYITHFGFDKAFFNGKKVLDIGCGPRGSLEWADMASERVGLDSLADSYRKLGAEKHKMKYVNGRSEQIPFPDGYFDIVSSFNSLDHVDNLDETIREIIRIVATGGLFLLLTDVNHKPTHCEPISFSWDVVEKFLSSFELVEEKHYEKSRGGLYESLQKGVLYEHASKLQRYGVLSAKFIKL